MSLHMMAKDVDIYGMYLVVKGNETKYVKEFTFQIQSNSVITNTLGPAKFVRYNRNSF
jgi:hypothetical protein